MTFSRTGVSLPSTLISAIEAVAARERRSVDEVLSEAVETFLLGRQETDGSGSRSGMSPKEAARLMLERRPFNKLPEGMTIRDMMTYGRM